MPYLPSYSGSHSIFRPRTRRDKAKILAIVSMAFNLASRIRDIKRRLFPAGDVLLLFTIVGLVLFFTRNWSNKAIIITAVIFLLQPVEWYHYIANLMNPAHQLPDLKVGEMYAEVAEYTKAGNFWDFISGNITLGQKASLLWAINAGRFFQTAGLFLLGVYIGRKQFFIPSERISTSGSEY